jgi:hypothetical protein
MEKVASLTVWEEIRRLARKGPPRLGAVAYVSSDSLIKFGKGDTLIADASDSAIKSGETSYKVLRAAYGRGAEVFSLPGLHAKVMLFGHTAVIGSANISLSSVENMVEAALITDNPSTAAAVRSLIFQLARQAHPVNSAFLDRIRRIKVIRHGGLRGGRRSKKLKVSEPKKRTWIIGTHELSEGDFPQEKKLAESGMRKAKKLKMHGKSDVTWVRWTGTGRFRRLAKAGNEVIQIFRALGRKRPVVCRNSSILMRKEESQCTRFYIEEPPNIDDTAISLDKFRQLLRRIGHPTNVGPTSERPLADAHAEAVKALWDFAT